MFSTKYFIVLALIILGVTGCSQDKPDLTIPMKAGDYQVRVDKIADGVKDPKVRTRTRCYPDGTFDPYKSYHQHKDCKLSNIKKTDKKVSFDLDCQKGAFANMKGAISYSVIDESIIWSATINNIDGNDIDVVTKGTGEYLGKCQ